MGLLDDIDIGLGTEKKPTGYAPPVRPVMQSRGVLGDIDVDLGVKETGLGEDVLETAYLAGRAITRIPKEVAAAGLSALRGGKISTEKGWSDKFIEETKKENEEFAKQYEGRPFMKEMASLPQNIGFSGAGIIAGLATGIPASILTTPFGGTIAGATTSGAAAYRMAKDQFMSDIMNTVNQQAITERGKGLTEKEWISIRDAYESASAKYGLWEAIPEAIGNAVSFGVLRAATSPMIAGIRNRVGRSLANAGFKLAEMQLGEQATETITGYGQGAIEAEAGLREKAPTLVEAFKEQAPQTALLTTFMGGAGAVGSKTYDLLKGKETTSTTTSQTLDKIKSDLATGKITIDDVAGMAQHPKAKEMGLTDALSQIIAEEQAKVAPSVVEAPAQEVAAIPVEEPLPEAPKGRLPGEPALIEGQPVSPEDEMVIEPAGPDFLERATEKLGGRVGPPVEEVEPTETMGKRTALDRLKLEVAGKKGRIKEEEPTKPTITLRQQADTIAKQVNDELPGNNLRFDKKWDIEIPNEKGGTDKKVHYQFTPYAGDAKGATFTTTELTPEAVRTVLTDKIAKFGKKKAEIEPVAPETPPESTITPEPIPEAVKGEEGAGEGTKRAIREVAIRQNSLEYTVVPSGENVIKTPNESFGFQVKTDAKKFLMLGDMAPETLYDQKQNRLIQKAIIGREATDNERNEVAKEIEKRGLIPRGLLNSDIVIDDTGKPWVVDVGNFEVKQDAGFKLPKEPKYMEPGKKPSPPEVSAKKEPWEMSREEFIQSAIDIKPKKELRSFGLNKTVINAGETHKTSVQQAITEGKITSHPDYPELGKKVEAAPKEEIKPESIERASGAASRFRPSKIVQFEKPITGPSGASLLSYQWMWKPEEYTDKFGEERIKRVSNWDEAIDSADTGRGIVHQFMVKMPDGKQKLVSSESVLSLLGYTEKQVGKKFPSLANAVKTMAKLQMQLEVAEQIESNQKKIFDEIKKIPFPPIELKGLSESGGSRIWKMGDATVWDHKLEGPLSDERKRTLEDAWIGKRAIEKGIKKYAITEHTKDIKEKIEHHTVKIEQIRSKISEEAASTESITEREERRKAEVVPAEKVKPEVKETPAKRPENLVIQPQIDGMFSLQDTEGNRLGTFKSADEAAKQAKEMGYGLLPESAKLVKPVVIQVKEITKAELEARLPEGKKLKDITVKVQAVRESTGEKIEVEDNAEAALAEIDEKLSTYRNILDCINA